MSKPPETALRSPDPDPGFLLDLRAENALRGGCDRGAPGLAEDRALLDALHCLGTPALSPAVRAGVLRQIARRPRPTVWLGLAATVCISLTAAALMHVIVDGRRADVQGSGAPALQDWRELNLALDTLHSNGEQVADLTRSGLARSLGAALTDLHDWPRGAVPAHWRSGFDKLSK